MFGDFEVGNVSYNAVKVFFFYRIVCKNEQKIVGFSVHMGQTFFHTFEQLSDTKPIRAEQNVIH